MVPPGRRSCRKSWRPPPQLPCRGNQHRILWQRAAAWWCHPKTRPRRRTQENPHRSDTGIL